MERIGYLKKGSSSIANPKVSKQKNQRYHFTVQTKLAKRLTFDLIKPIWKKMDGDITGNNLFTETTISLFATDGTILQRRSAGNLFRRLY